jgi:hypothetical protein
MTVVAGRVTVPDDSKRVPQVMALAVPLSVIAILKVSPSTGVPVTPEVIEVIAAACAVKIYISVESVL